MTSTDLCNAPRNDAWMNWFINLFEEASKPSLRKKKLLNLLKWNSWKILNSRMEYSREGGWIVAILLTSWSYPTEKEHYMVYTMMLAILALNVQYTKPVRYFTSLEWWRALRRESHKCECCFRKKAINQRAAPYISIEPDNRDTRNVLVITGHFTLIIAKALQENCIVHSDRLWIQVYQITVQL